MHASTFTWDVCNNYEFLYTTLCIHYTAELAKLDLVLVINKMDVASYSQLHACVYGYHV